MNKTLKLLKKLLPKDRRAIIAKMELLMIGNWLGLDVEKMKGQNGIFRCRVGSFRIIFGFSNGIFELLEIKRRNETTYKNF